MGADQDINITCCQLLDGFFLFGSRFKTIDIIYRAGEFLQPFTESLEVLQRQDSGRHQERNLLTFSNSFECSPDGNLSLAEANIPTDQPIHRIPGFHIFLDIKCGLQLVRCILIKKGRLQLSLKVCIRGK